MRWCRKSMTISLPKGENGRPSDSDAGRPPGMGGPPRRPLFSLGARLALCASLVRPGTALADVGTDHAYLPIWLAGSGLIRSAVACDVRPGPLSRARRNIARYGVQSLVSARLSDGLEAVAPPEAEDVVIAGMGGLMMIHVLENAPWLKEGDRRLILQPMTSAPELREHLAREGWTVLREQAAEEGGHIYAAMQAAFRPGGWECGELFPYIGRMTAGTGEGRKYLLREMRRLEKQARGLASCGESGEAARLFRLSEQIGLLLPGGEKKP